MNIHSTNTAQPPIDHPSGVDQVDYRISAESNVAEVKSASQRTSWELGQSARGDESDRGLEADRLRRHGELFGVVEGDGRVDAMSGTGGFQRRVGTDLIEAADKALAAARAKRKQRDAETEAATVESGNAQKRLRTDVEFTRTNRSLTVCRVTIPKGATIVGQQAEQAKLATKRKATTEAKPTLASVVADIDAIIAAAASGPAIIGIGSPHGMQVRWPITRVAGALADGGVVPHVIDTAQVAAWLAPEKVRATLVKQVEQFYRDYDGLVMDATQKHRQLAEIDAAILASQRIEAELVWQQYAAGGPLNLRPELDPRATLGVE